MARVFKKDAYLFYFYNNNHQPIHVCVRYGSGEAVFEVGTLVELRVSQWEGVG